MNIGPNIVRFRRQKGMSLVQLARRLDTHPSNVKRWETGRVSPRWETVVRIAEALEVPVEDLAAGEDTRSAMRAGSARDEGMAVASLGVLNFDPREGDDEAADDAVEEDALLYRTTTHLAANHEQRARTYRRLSRVLRLPRFRPLREAIAELPEDLSGEEVRELAEVLRRAVRRR